MDSDLRERLARLSSQQQRELAQQLRRDRLQRAADEPAPLSYAQERLWFLDRLDPGNPAYTVCFAIRLRGALDVEALHTAARRIVARHEALRMVFTEVDGEPRQVVTAEPTVPLPIVDRAEFGVPHRFDLTCGPLLALRLAADAEGDHLLQVTVHHIAFDGWSSRLFGIELAAHYRESVTGEPASLPAPQIGFIDHARGERARGEDELRRDLDWWNEALAGAPTVSTVPPDRPRPAAQTHRGMRRTLDIGPEVADRLDRLARRAGVTLNATVLAAFGMVLGRMCGQDEVLLGVPISGRTTTAVEPLIGCFANTVIIRVDLTGEPALPELAGRVHRAIGDAQAHQAAPYARVVERVAPTRDRRRNPLFQVMISVAELAADPTPAAGVAFSFESGDAEATDFDLFVTVHRSDAGLCAVVHYNTDLYLDETIGTVLDRFAAVLGESGASGSALGRLPGRRRVRIASTFTTEPLRDSLAFWSDYLRLGFDVDFAPYGQVVQHLLATPTGSEPDAIVVLFRPGRQTAELVSDLEAAIGHHARWSTVPLLLVICPDGPAGTDPQVTERLARFALRPPRVEAAVIESWLERHGLAPHRIGEVFDDAAADLGDVPYTDEAFAVLGTLIGRHLARLWEAEPGPERLGDIRGRLSTAAAIADCATVAARDRRVARVGEPERHSDTVPARTPTEHRLLALWRRLLDAERIGVTSDFFGVGGHSLLAVRLLSAVRTELGCDVTLPAFFAEPTIEQLARAVDRSSGSTVPDTQAVVPASRVPDRVLHPSSGQQRLWAMDRLAGEDPTQHSFTLAARLDGPLDTAALFAAFDRLIARHEALRTTIADHRGRPVLRIVEAGRDAGRADHRLPDVDLSRLDEADRAAAVAGHVARHAAEPYDLATGPLLRVRLLREHGESTHLLIGMHHIVCDNASWAIFCDELAALYRAQVTGEPDGLAPLALHHTDFAQWQHGWSASQDCRRRVGYWRDRLAGAPARPQLPTDRPRTAARAHRAERLEHRIAGDTMGRLRELVRGEDTTVFAGMLAGLAVALRRRSGLADIVLGVPVGGRDRPGLTEPIGPFGDLLPFRIDVGAEPTFRRLLRHTHTVMSEALAHQDVPLASIVETLRPTRSPGAHPLFQTVVSFVDRPPTTLQLHGLRTVEHGQPPTTTEFDLFINLRWRAAEMAAIVDYSPALFDRDTVRELLEEFEQALAHLGSHPDDPLTPVVESDGPRVLTDRFFTGLLDTDGSTEVRYRFGERVSSRSAGEVRLEPAVRLLEGEIDDLAVAAHRWARRSRGRLVFACAAAPLPSPAPIWSGLFGRLQDRLRLLVRDLPNVGFVPMPADDRPPPVTEPGRSAAPTASPTAEAPAASAAPAPPDGTEVFTAAGGTVPPRTPIEQALAEIWADLLRVERVGVTDDFFALGGDSLLAIRAAFAAVEAGVPVAPRQVIDHPTIASLAERVAERRSTEAAPIADGGDDPAWAPLTGPQRWYLEEVGARSPRPEHFTHPYSLRLRRRIAPEVLEGALELLAARHDALRLRLVHDDDGRHQRSDATFPFERHDLSDAPAPAEQARELFAEAQRSLDLAGPLARAVHVRLGDDEPDRLLLVCHHLVTDGISRGILLNDLQQLCRRVEAGTDEPPPPARPTYLAWARAAAAYAESPGGRRELEWWRERIGSRTPDAGLEAELADVPTRFGRLRTGESWLSSTETDALRRTGRQLGVRMSTIATWAVCDVLAEWTGVRERTIALTGHGRERLGGIDPTGTVGWFQHFFPVPIDLPTGSADADAIVAVDRQVAEVPATGLGSNLLRYAGDRPAAHPQVAFNYSGRFSFLHADEGRDLFEVCTDPIGAAQNPEGQWILRLDIGAAEIDGRLRLTVIASDQVYRTSTMAALADRIAERLRRCAEKGA